jgi:hypothetical protein
MQPCVSVSVLMFSYAFFEYQCFQTKAWLRSGTASYDGFWLMFPLFFVCGSDEEHDDGITDAQKVSRAYLRDMQLKSADMSFKGDGAVTFV